MVGRRVARRLRLVCGIVLLALLVGYILMGAQSWLAFRELGALLARVSQLHSQGKYDEALPLAERYVALARQLYDEDHWQFASAVLWLGAIHQDQGSTDEAEPLVRRALSIYEKALAPDHPDISAALSYLAEVYRAQGRYPEAEPLYKRGLVIDEKAIGPDHPQVSFMLNGLAELYREQGRHSEAEPLYKRSLAIREKALGTNHLLVAASLGSFAQLHHTQGRYADAESLYKQSLSIRERVLGASHPLVAVSLDSLAALYRDQDRYADAEPLYKHSLLIWKTTLGDHHPHVAASLHNLAALHFAQQRWAMAADYWRQVTELTIRNSSRGADVLGQGKQNAQRNGYPFRGLIKAAHRVALESPASAPVLATEMFLTAQWAQSSRAAVYLAQVEARIAKRDDGPARVLGERQKLFAEWQGKNKRLIAALSEPPERRKSGAQALLKARLTSIDARISEIDRILAKDFSDYVALANPKPRTVAEVQARLRVDEAMVLFLDTPRIHPLPNGATFVWAITKTDMRWVRIELGTEALIERVAALRCGLDRSAWDGGGKRRCAHLLGIAVERAPKDDGPLPFDLFRAHELHKALFGTVEDLIRDKRLIIVPSGPLTALPFHVLVTEKPAVAIPGEVVGYADAAWLAKRHTVTVLPTVASLKVLRQFAQASGATQPFVGIGNPLLLGPSGDDLRAWKRQSCPKNSPSPIHLANQPVRVGISAFFRSGLANVDEVRAQHPLPQTADELCAVAQMIGASVSAVHLGTNATEENVKALSAKGALAQARVIHFATHGLLAGETAELGANKAEPALILTPPDKATEVDDGLLTASEIAQLKLDADWVVLSACNTAAGSSDKPATEALSGLARAFFYAGARALLVSHWAVNSDATVKLVTGTFGAMRINPKGGRAEALRWSKLALMQSGGNNAHPALWAPFVVVGEGAHN